MQNQSEICRLCRKYEENTVSLLDGKGSSGVSYNDMLQITCNIKLSSEDGFPSTACRICVWNLNLSFNFISQCKHSERWFLNSCSATPKQSINLQRRSRGNILPSSSLTTNQKHENINETEAVVLDELEASVNNEDTDIENDNASSHSEWNPQGDERNEDSDSSTHSKTKDSKDLTNGHNKNAEKNIIEDKSCICEICGGKFQDEFYYTHHVHDQNDKDSKRITYKCSFCEKLYICKFSFKNHYNMHQGFVGHICEICGRKFVSSSNLTAHMTTHTDKLPFECHLCKKKFRRKIYLNGHLLIHKGEKKFSCEACGRKFIKKGALVAHMRTHGGDKYKKYKCEFCPMKFLGKRDMIDHSRTHTGERPFACKYCDRTFSQRNCLRGHLKTHKECKTFDCAICNKKFLKPVSLRVHLRTHEENAHQDVEDAE